MTGVLFDDDGVFLGPVEAAVHACFVQGGFSTPYVEAERMIKQGGLLKERAEMWLMFDFMARFAALGEKPPRPPISPQEEIFLQRYVMPGKPGYRYRRTPRVLTREGRLR